MAPVENLNAPLPNKVNGCSINSNSHEESSSFPNATTQILFCSESTENPHRDHFRDLIQSLSTCLRIELCESNEAIGIFRSSKYELEISLEAVNILKQYLSRQGHVLILNIFQTWIYLDIVDIKAEEGKGMFNLQEVVEDRVDPSTSKEVSTQRSIKQEDAGEGTSKSSKGTTVHLRQLKHSVHRLKKIETPTRTMKISDPTQR